jgi:hypothetical protein
LILDASEGVSGSVQSDCHLIEARLVQFNQHPIGAVGMYEDHPPSTGSDRRLRSDEAHARISKPLQARVKIGHLEAKVMYPGTPLLEKTGDTALLRSWPHQLDLPLVGGQKGYGGLLIGEVFHTTDLQAQGLAPEPEGIVQVIDNDRHMMDPASLRHGESSG